MIVFKVILHRLVHLVFSVQFHESPYGTCSSTHPSRQLPDLLRLEGRVRVQRRHERARLVVLAAAGARRARRRAPPALCTETSRRRHMLPPVLARGGRPVPVLILLVMVRGIHTAFKPSSAGNAMKEKTKKHKGTGRGEANESNASTRSYCSCYWVLVGQY